MEKSLFVRYKGSRLFLHTNQGVLVRGVVGEMQRTGEYRMCMRHGLANSSEHQTTCGVQASILQNTEPTSCSIHWQCDFTGKSKIPLHSQQPFNHHLHPGRPYFKISSTLYLLLLLVSLYKSLCMEHLIYFSVNNNQS